MNNLPPQNIDSEMSILGSVFIDQTSLDRIMSTLTIEDFYREAHRKILQAMLVLNDRNEPCDFVTMSALLKEQGYLEEVGGAAYLLMLADYVPTSANVAYYCKIVLEMATKRRFQAQAQQTLSMIESGSTSEEIAEKMESNLTGMFKQQHNEPVATPQLVKEAVKRLKGRYQQKGALQGMSWGIDGLDSVTNGIHRGELVIIAGRPSMGKSVMASNILRAACVSGKHGMLFSLEMSKEDCMDRFFADRGNIKLHHIRNGRLEDSEWIKCTNTCADITGWNLFIDDTPGVTLRDVKAKIKRQKRKGLDIAVIDYLQLMSIPAKDNRVQGLGEISRGLKIIARELDIAIILLSQLNRTVDSRPDKRPLMSDLRDSGEIEQDADVIIFPFRPAAYCPKCRDRAEDDCNHIYREHQAQAEIIIEKQRNGERNISIPVAWMGMFQRFEQL
jgi:replicative DNA helicase